MKTKIFSLIAFIAIVLSTQNANAKIRRVGYFGTAINGTDYGDLQSAHDAASAGDTLFIFPGSWNANFSKKLNVIGYGYGVTGSGSNVNLQNITGSMTILIYLYSGSDSTLFQGLDKLGILVYDPNASVNNIKINRCSLNGPTGFGPLGIYNFYPYTLANWQITQCWDVYINTASKFSNLLVSNSYLNQVYLFTSNSQTGLFSNNIFASYSDLGRGSFQLQNNIFLQGDIGNNTNCVYNNCICNTDYFSLPAGNGNQSLTNTQFNNLFVGYPNQGSNSFDGRFVLKAGSLAIGTGAGGVDCGIFGTTTPYKLSGIPPIPAFYKLTAPSNTTSTNPYTITFSVRTNN